MSLRIKLVLAFAAVVLLMVVVSLLSLRSSYRVRARVADLTSTSIAQFERDMSLGQALELEGEWRDGAFVSDEFERLLHPRRPKLRGAIAAVDRDAGVVTMYGVSIAVDRDTEFLDDPDTGLASLRPGLRAEISCAVTDDGAWSARKIRTAGIKASDKVKGTITALAMDGVAPDSLEIHGLTVVLEIPERDLNPRTELRRISLAMRMSRALVDCRIAAQNVLSHRDVTTPDGDDVPPRVLLLESGEDLGRYVEQARKLAESHGLVAGDGTGEVTGAESAEFQEGLWLASLDEGYRTLLEHIEEFFCEFDEDEYAAGYYLEEHLEPFLQGELLPLVESYRQDAEEAVALEVDAITAQAGVTARSLLITSAVALLVAIGLGLVIWSSISQPLLDLTAAAERIGHGHLDTRVTVNSRDELGVLAGAINRMAGELAGTTVSMGNLENIIDSMAGALLVLDAEGRITRANRAAAVLLGYDDGALVQVPFADICHDADGDAWPHAPGGGGLDTGERLLVRRDGAPVPVSFAGATLQGDGEARGYVCIAQDLTARKQLEEQLRRSLGEKELLLREVHHRVKNNLQVISSLLDLQASQLEDDESRLIYEDSQSRIRSMALIHQQLYNATELDRIDFGAYLETLAASLFTSFGGGRHEVDLRAEVAPARLAIDQALACGLIINELVTNALKHAFTPDRRGELVIRFATLDGTHRLEVADNGRGMDAEAAAAATGSLGMSLVGAFVEQLHGEMTIINEAGTTFRVDFPAEEDNGQEGPA